MGLLAFSQHADRQGKTRPNLPGLRSLHVSWLPKQNFGFPIRKLQDFNPIFETDRLQSLQRIGRETSKRKADRVRELQMVLIGQHKSSDF